MTDNAGESMKCQSIIVLSEGAASIIFKSQ